MTSTRRTWTVFYWSDSKVVLGWIRGDSQRWKQFVANQVVKIQAASSKDSWRHISGTDNPADLSSRGAPAGQLVKSELWWDGPPWLAKSTEEWPQEPELRDTAISDTINSETKKTTPAKTTTVGVIAVEKARKFSSFEKLIRVSAWMLRATNQIRQR